MSNLEDERSIHELKKLWANIAKALLYHQNEFSKLSQRLQELNGIFGMRKIKPPSLPNNLGWILKKE